jgi:hypothetical protein
MQVCSPNPVYTMQTESVSAALCTETKDRQAEILEILRMVLSISKFPSITILDDLVNVWGGNTNS